MSAGEASLQYKLFYHDGKFAGRGEPIRMMLDVCGVSWEDTARVKHLFGPGIRDYVRDTENGSYPVLHPPSLIDCAENTTVNQMSCILQYLGEKHGLAGGNLIEKAHALQIALAWNDLLAKAAVAYHPIEISATYQSQKEAAIPYVAKFMETQVPTYLMYFEECLEKNDEGRGYMVGANLSFADICILNMMRGYKGSAPEHYDANQSIPLLKQLEARLREEPKIKAFLVSDRTVDHFYDSFL